MLPDEMEAEKNRKIILSQAEEIEVLKKNVYDLQGQLQKAYMRIEELTSKSRETTPVDRNYKWWAELPYASDDFGSK